MTSISSSLSVSVPNRGLNFIGSFVANEKGYTCSIVVTGEDSWLSTDDGGVGRSAHCLLLIFLASLS